MAKRYYRRGHWVNAPSKRESGSGLFIVLLVAAVLWALGNGGGDDNSEPNPTTPASSAPAQAPAPGQDP